MKSGIWLSRRMLRGLIVLLALMPIVPAMLMMRIQVQNAERDRDLAVSEATATYQGQLALFVSRLSMTTRPGEATADAMLSYLRQIFGEEVSISISDPQGNLVLRRGEPPTYTAIEARPVIGGFRGWTTEVDGVAVIPEHVAEQLKDAWRNSLIIVALVTLAAAIAWFVVNRGLRVDELRADLIATVSHEMRTPLSSMRVLLETLEDAGPDIDEETREDYLRLMTKENERLTRLAESFLTWSRLEKGDSVIKSESVRVTDAVDRALRRLDSRIEETNAEIDSTGVSNQAIVSADPESLAIIMTNLIENGLKYGGTPPRITVIATPDGTVSVRDNGKGIPREIRRRVFGKYFQGERRLSSGDTGVGLGLAICRQLVRKMQGKIEVSRENGAELVMRLRPIRG